MGTAEAQAQTMTSIVCDASIVVKLLIREENTEQAISLASSHRLSAPELLVAEVGNALWARVHDGSFGVDTAQELIQKFYDLSLNLQPLRPLLGRAIAFAHVLDHPIYDCFYLALAEKLSVPIITVDRRFISAVRRRRLESVEILRLGEVT
jgi:predicted nucleic acid-binding protein